MDFELRGKNGKKVDNLLSLEQVNGGQPMTSSGTYIYVYIYNYLSLFFFCFSMFISLLHLPSLHGGSRNSLILTLCAGEELSQKCRPMSSPFCKERLCNSVGTKITLTLFVQQHRRDVVSQVLGTKFCNRFPLVGQRAAGWFSRGSPLQKEGWGPTPLVRTPSEPLPQTCFSPNFDLTWTRFGPEMPFFRPKSGQNPGQNQVVQLGRVGSAGMTL